MWILLHTSAKGMCISMAFLKPLILKLMGRELRMFLHLFTIRNLSQCHNQRSLHHITQGSVHQDIQKNNTVTLTVFVSMASINRKIKETWCRKGLLTFTVHNVSCRKVRAATQDMNLEAGPKQQPWRNIVHRLVPPGLLSLLSYTPQDHQLKGGTTPNGMEPLPAIINQENSPPTCLQASLSSKLLSSQVTLAYVMLVTKALTNAVTIQNVQLQRVQKE